MIDCIRILLHLTSVLLSNFQRHELVTCPPDPMAADPEKQTITSLNYLLGRQVLHVRTVRYIQYHSEAC